MFRVVFPFVLTFVVVQSVLADSLDDYIQRQMTARHIPGAVLIVLKDGKILKQGAYGFSNAELDIPMSTDNVFPVASITKIFVTTAVFLLVQDGRLNLNDKITDLLPGLPNMWRESRC